MTEPKRKGARSIKDIMPDIMQQLNSGKIESANLVETKNGEFAPRQLYTVCDPPILRHLFLKKYVNM